MHALIGNSVVVKGAVVLENVETAAKIQVAGHGHGNFGACAQRRQPDSGANLAEVSLVCGLRRLGGWGFWRGNSRG